MQLIPLTVQSQSIKCLCLFLGADYWSKDTSGRCAFDYVKDHEEWIGSGYFSEEIRAKLKGKLKCTIVPKHTQLTFQLFLQHSV